MVNAQEPGKSDQFDSFWEASNYTPFNIKEFAAAQEAYSSKGKVDSVLEYPSEPLKLPLPKTAFSRRTKKRKSERDFSDKPLSKRELGVLLSSFYAHNGLEHRAFPSAGASYAIEVFCSTNNVHGFNKEIFYYNPDLHALSKIGKAPKWKEASENINVLVKGIPQCLIIFVLFPNRLTEKYLERGGRFSLIEAGAALQQLVIQIAGAKGLKGVAAGGMIDDYWQQKLNLHPQESKIALGYLCGK